MTINELQEIAERIGFKDNGSTSNGIYAIYRYTSPTKYLKDENSCNCIIIKDKDSLKVEFYCNCIVGDCITTVAEKKWIFSNVNTLNSVKFENDVKEMLDYTKSIQLDFYRHTIAMQNKMDLKTQRINPEN